MLEYFARHRCERNWSVVAGFMCGTFLQYSSHVCDHPVLGSLPSRNDFFVDSNQYGSQFNTTVFQDAGWDQIWTNGFVNIDFLQQLEDSVSLNIDVWYRWEAIWHNRCWLDGLSCVDTNVQWRERISALSSASSQSSPLSYSSGGMPMLSCLCDFV